MSIFSNQDLKRSDYPLIETQIPKYDRICEVLYSPEEREKLEKFYIDTSKGDNR